MRALLLMGCTRYGLPGGERTPRASRITYLLTYLLTYCTISQVASALLERPLLHATVAELRSSYGTYLLHVVRCAHEWILRVAQPHIEQPSQEQGTGYRTEEASEGQAAFSSLLAFLEALLSLLPHAAQLVSKSVSQ